MVPCSVIKPAIDLGQINDQAQTAATLTLSPREIPKMKSTVLSIISLPPMKMDLIVMRASHLLTLKKRLL